MEIISSLCSFRILVQYFLCRILCTNIFFFPLCSQSGITSSGCCVVHVFIVTGQISVVIPPPPLPFSSLSLGSWPLLSESPSAFKIHPFRYYLLHSLTVPFLLSCLMSPSLGITHQTNGRGSISDSCKHWCRSLQCSGMHASQHQAFSWHKCLVSFRLSILGNALQVPRVWPWCGSHAQVLCSWTQLSWSLLWFFLLTLESWWASSIWGSPVYPRF